MVTEMGSMPVGGMSPALSANAAKSFLEATDKEKKEMQSLNDRLANYIDRVKQLEEQNRKLVGDLEDLRGRWGKDTSEIKVEKIKLHLSHQFTLILDQIHEHSVFGTKRH
jgi:predicted nuclease with TOPRIM domain